MSRNCDVCGSCYEAKRPSSRYCSDRCRKRAQRRPARPAPKASAGELGELEVVTREELVKAGRETTALGKAALLLARGIDTAPAESGTSQAARFREWQSMLGKATAGAGGEKSPLDRMRDELAERRARRGA